MILLFFYAATNNLTRNAKLAAKALTIGLSVKGANLVSQFNMVEHPKSVEQTKKAIDPKATKTLNWPTTKLAGVAKMKNFEESSPFEPKIIDKPGVSFPSNLCAFKMFP